MKARKATPLAQIQLLILDVDGVLTDGRLYFGAKGEALKVFHVRDGHGIKLIMAAGVRVAAFSGRRSAATAARLSELGVPTLVQGCTDKLLALHRLTTRLKINPLNCACIVDDTPDLPLMSAVGLAAAVADAHPLVLSAAHWVAGSPGGLGAELDEVASWRIVGPSALRARSFAARPAEVEQARAWSGSGGGPNSPSLRCPNIGRCAKNLGSRIRPVWGTDAAILTYLNKHPSDLGRH